MSYIVKIPKTPHTDASSFLHEIGMWAHDHCGGLWKRWIWIDVPHSKDYLSIAISFKNEKDAIMFKLRWL